MPPTDVIPAEGFETAHAAEAGSGEGASDTRPVPRPNSLDGGRAGTATVGDAHAHGPPSRSRSGSLMGPDSGRDAARAGSNDWGSCQDSTIQGDYPSSAAGGPTAAEPPGEPSVAAGHGSGTADGAATDPEERPAAATAAKRRRSEEEECSPSGAEESTPAAATGSPVKRRCSGAATDPAEAVCGRSTQGLVGEAGMLPPPDMQASLYELEGPHPSCNWLLRDRLIVGAFPGHPDGGERHRSAAKSVVRTGKEGGVTFISLIEEDELAWRRLMPYAEYAIGEAEKYSYPRPEFLQCEIPDTSVGPDRTMRGCLEVAAGRIRAGRLVYVHCFGGKGRTGTFAVGFLTRFCGVSADAALSHFVRAHDARQHQGIGVTRSLHGVQQTRQARRLGLEGPGQGEGCFDTLVDMPLVW
eukprot:TRINITY_DN4062_c0_g1_i1.p1 TRINITY_DN4062_c0_g1~~TRINITY_DN4062_c0_g1_i1.p1  ORF type:complete len:436 (+),score=84.27 TRINITY_DN4062_c0_g1_i1:73-1308(+)